MEKEKYYTPTIEEFHVGFEIQIVNIENAQWGIYVIKKEDSFKEFDLDFCRVKYLDKEDIESFGFKLVQSGSNGCSSYKLKDLYITINEINYSNILISNNKEHQFFIPITIKNKSEFSRLLKQLSII